MTSEETGVGIERFRSRRCIVPKAIPTVVLVSIALLIAGCASSGSAGLPKGAVGGGEASMYGDQTLMDWTSQEAGVVIEGTVAGVKAMAPLDSGPDHKAYGYNLIVHVDRVLWKEVDEVPATIVVTGPMSTKKDDGRIVELEFPGAYRLRKGDQFVGAIVLSPGLGVDGFLQTRTAVIKVTDGKLSPIERAPEYQQELAGKSVDDLQKLLQG